jgi:DNA-binding FadR family transcriptional regulator
MALAQEFIVAAQLDCQFHILIVDLAGNKLLRCICRWMQKAA